MNELRVEFEIQAQIPMRKRVVQSNFGRHRRRLENHSELKPIFEILGQSQVPVDIRRKALEICTSFHEHEKGRNYPRAIVGKASLFTANRLCGIPRPMRDFAKTPKERHQTLRCHQRICKVLGLHISRLGVADHLQYIVEKKKAGENVVQFATRLVDEAQSERIVKGSSPMGIAAAIFYLACISMNVKVTQREIASIAGVSEITVRTDCRILKKLIDRQEAVSLNTEIIAAAS